MLDLAVVLQVDHRDRRGPFDIIGDVHGCLGELHALFEALGYLMADDGTWRSPSGRLPVFVGDLVDRGPDSSGVLRLVMRLVRHRVALAVPGNHDLQLLRWLDGVPTPVLHGLDTTIAEFEDLPRAWRDDVRRFLHALPSHVVLDDGNLVVAHTGLAERWHGSESDEIRQLAAYGVTSGEVDGHDVSAPPRLACGLQGTRDRGLWAHGGRSKPSGRDRRSTWTPAASTAAALTALRWPERELVSVPAARAYAVQDRPMVPS